jgi:hypothetical protein
MAVETTSEIVSGDTALEAMLNIDGKFADDIGEIPPVSAADNDSLKLASAASYAEETKSDGSKSQLDSKTDTQVKPSVESTPSETKVLSADTKPLVENKPLVTLPNPLPESRDYTGYTTEEAALLQRMPNEAFAFVTKRFKEAQELKASVSSEIDGLKREALNAYSNPFGYERDADYTQKAETAKLAGDYAAHYKQQLVAIQKGEQWTDIQVGADGKLNSTVYDASPESSAHVMDRLQTLRANQQRFFQEAESIKNNWTHKSQQVNGFIAAQEQKFFPNYTGKESTNTDIQYIKKELVNLGQGSNPMAGMISKLYATTQDLSRAYDGLLSRYNELQTKQQVAASVLPSTTQLVAGKAGNASNTNGVSDAYDDKEFERLYGDVRR